MTDRDAGYSENLLHLVGDIIERILILFLCYFFGFDVDVLGCLLL